jgi:hypothetical protein
MKFRSIDTIPVPMVTENQLGLKLRTTRRQPTSYLVKSGGKVSFSPFFKLFCFRTLPFRDLGGGNLTLAGSATAGLSAAGSMAVELMAGFPLGVFDVEYGFMRPQPKMMEFAVEWRLES